MLEKQELLSKFNKIREIAKEYYNKREYEKSLRSIMLLGRLRYMVNLDYYDEEIEELIRCILVDIQSSNINKRTSQEQDDLEYIVFYDSFGLDIRGLALIYLKALTDLDYNIIYVTKKQQMDAIPTLRGILKNNKNNLLVFIDDMPIIETYQELSVKLEKYIVKSILLYMDPYDLVGILLGIRYENLATRYLINLTDHAFWLGTNSFDYSVEFRDYGANVSHYYRNVEKNKIIKLPYYPIINKEFQFEGFPEEVQNKKIIFSGGSLYKTLGAENKYYKIVDYLLKKHNDIVFIYAGYGDCSELNKLILKYPNRVFHINERKDLFEMMRHSYLYLSTFPMIGGLMTQYAVSANILPFTLIYDECGTGVLLNPDELNIEFYDVNELLKELDRCIEDEHYMILKKRNLNSQLITEDMFKRGIFNLVEEKRTDFDIHFKYVDTEAFRKTYLERLSKKDIYSVFGKRKFFATSKYFPFELLQGLVSNIKEELCK